MQGAAATGLAALYFGLHWETQQLIGALVAAFFVFSVDQVYLLHVQEDVQACRVHEHANAGWIIQHTLTP